MIAVSVKIASMYVQFIKKNRNICLTLNLDHRSFSNIDANRPTPRNSVKLQFSANRLLANEKRIIIIGRLFRFLGDIF